MCVPDVIGVLGVWIQNKNKNKTPEWANRTLAVVRVERVDSIFSIAE